MVFSIVVPVYNESDALPEFYRRLSEAAGKTGEDHEIIFVDDGSRDDSWGQISSFHSQNPRVKCLSLSRNFGHQVAIAAGLNFARADATIVMDADLQDPPELIPEFLKKWREGYDVVYGVRSKRKDGLLKVLFCAAYYRLLKAISKTEINLDSGDFCLMDKRVAELLNSFPERNRFIRGLRSWVGLRQYALEYKRDERIAGKPKYTLFKLIKLGLDGIFSFSGAPLRASAIIGTCISFLSVCYAVFILVNRILYPTERIPGWATLSVAVTFLGGVQLIVLGLLGEYVLRILDEVKRRPLYVVDKAIGLDAKDAQNLRNHSGV